MVRKDTFLLPSPSEEEEEEEEGGGRKRREAISLREGGREGGVR